MCCRANGWMEGRETGVGEFRVAVQEYFGNYLMKRRTFFVSEICGKLFFEAKFLKAIVVVLHHLLQYMWQNFR